MKALAFATLVSLCGCEFAVKHPPATAAIFGGSLAIATCEIGTDFEEHKACAVISLGAAAVLGMVTFLAIAVGGKGDTVLGSTEAVEDERVVPYDPTLDQDPYASPGPDAPPPPTPDPNTTPSSPSSDPAPTPSAPPAP